jgi:hypothetical protein
MRLGPALGESRYVRRSITVQTTMSAAGVRIEAQLFRAAAKRVIPGVKLP